MEFSEGAVKNLERYRHFEL